MPRMRDADIEKLKKTYPVADAIEASGVELVRRGAQLVGRCPFHDDRTPSLIVTPSKNLWHCMGACQTGGSVIDWVMKRHAVPFVRAVEMLTSRQKITSPRIQPRSPEPEEPSIEQQREDQAALEEVVSHYHNTLKDSPAALEYLERRGLRQPGMIEHFRLGFSDRTLAKLIPDRRSEAGIEKRRQLERIGIFRQGYEHFAGSIVIPILDTEGRVVGMYGRRTAPPSAGTPVHRYLPGPHRGVFNERALIASDEIILCEALIDALSFWCAGFQNVISSYGVEGFTAVHLAALKKHRTQRVLIAYDRDAAGDRASEQLAKKLSDEGIACHRVEFPKGIDANEYARQLKPAEKSLDLVLRKAVPILGAPPRPLRPEVLMAASMPTEIAAPTPVAIEPAPIVVPSPTQEPSPPLAAVPREGTSPSPVVAPLLTPPTDIHVEERGEEIYLSIGDRRYRVRGLAKNTSMDSLRVNLLGVRGELYFVDSVDLYSARQRAAYTRQAAAELEMTEDVVRTDLGKLLRKLEVIQSERIKALMEPKSARPEISEEDHAEAMELLTNPRIFDRILEDFERAGVVGEETNKLLAYVAAVSRKLEDPLAVMVQSASAAGKSSLVEAVLAFMPEEERLKYSAMTGQSLYYMGETNLQNKILAIAEEEGAERASYALKLLQSEHELTIASTGKDPASGRLITHEYKVRGPVMIFLTTTALEVDEELLNRAFVLTVDEDRAQTQAIHRLQRKRETLEGLIAGRERRRILRIHQNAQRLLRSVLVANPHAEALTFLDHRTRTRRDHMKYLALIRAIALLRQYQKVTKTAETELGEVIEYIEVEPSDIDVANRLSREILGRTLGELPPQTDRLLSAIEAFVAARAAEQKVTWREVRFTRREIREATQLGNTQLKLHMKRLEDLEYVALRGGRGYRFEYELVAMGARGGRGTGLAEPTRLGWSASASTWSGAEAKMVGPEDRDGRGVSGDGRPPSTAQIQRENQPLAAERSAQPKAHVNGATNGTHGPVVIAKARAS